MSSMLLAGKFLWSSNSYSPNVSPVFLSIHDTSSLRLEIIIFESLPFHLLQFCLPLLASHFTPQNSEIGNN